MSDGTGKTSTWPSYVLDRAARIPPGDSNVVPGSTPVVSFGHPLRPQVATLGINPSSSEFLSTDGSLLAERKRRLATLASLGIATHDEIDREGASQIVDDCAAYFGRNPYHWFNVLDRILAQALGVSYSNGRACHLDLVQWATHPVWSGLSDEARARLLSEDRPFLVEQLRQENYRLIVVAGRTAVTWVQQAGLTRWTPLARLEGKPAAAFYAGDTASPRFVGWSCNLQSQPGARQHIPRLVELLGNSAQRFPGGDAPMEKDGLFAKGTHFKTRSELIAHLEAWLETSDSPTIGDASRFGRAPWISFESRHGLVDLNADTHRSAVERMVQFMRLHPSADWHVVGNRNGRVNKVLFSREKDSAKRWAAYLRQALDEPDIIQEIR